MEKHKLYTFFPPNLLAVSKIRKYVRGSVFTLHEQVALILDGVLAEDILVELKDVPVTLRLAAGGDMVNAEEVVTPSFRIKQFVCETPEVTVAVIPFSYFTTNLRKTNLEVQNALSQELLSGVAKYARDVAETSINLRCGNAPEKILWALKRLQKLANIGNTLPVVKERLATHVGLDPCTVSRVLTDMEANGIIAKNSRTQVMLLD
jgi:hypothetical protein